MRNVLFLIASLALTGCDALAPSSTTRSQQQPGASGFASQAEAVIKEALDDWVFGDATFKADSDANIRFGDVDYNTGVPLTSYEIVATREVDPGKIACVAVRLVFPTRGGVHEIKKSVSYTVWKSDAGYWQTGMAIDASVKRGVSSGS